MAVENTNKRNFSVYPNPAANGIFSVQSSDTISKIRAFDMFGKSIPVESIGANQFKINAAPGIYQLSMTSEKQEKQPVKLIVR